MKRLLALTLALLVAMSGLTIVSAAGGATLEKVSFGKLTLEPDFDSNTFEYKIGLSDGEIPDPTYIAETGASVEVKKATKAGETTEIKVTSASGDSVNTYKFKFYGIRTVEEPALNRASIVQSNQVYLHNNTFHKGGVANAAFLQFIGKDGQKDKNVWVFFRIDLTTIPEGADKLDVVLYSTASATHQNNIRNYNWTIGIYDAPGASETWVHTNIPSQMVASGATVDDLVGERIGEITSDSKELNKSFTYVSGDITDYLLAKKEAGETLTTIGLAIESTDFTGSHSLVFHPAHHTSEANRPYLRWVTYPADRVNTLKSISFENGAIAEKISAGKTEYKVAKFETGELKAKYITTSPFAKVEESVDENGNIILKVIAESGEENVYTFIPVSAEEAGFKANGKIEIEKDDEGNNNFEITVDETVKSTVEIKNAAQTKKTFFFVTNAVKDGKLVGRTTEKITVDPGYYTLETETSVPEDKDGLKIVSYIAEDDEFTPIDTPVTYGEADEFEKSEALSVKYANVAEDVLTVSGKAENVKIVNVFVLKEGKAFDDYDGENFDEVFLFTDMIECENGYYGLSLNLDGESEEEYTILVNDEEVAFNFENKESREDMFSDMVLSVDLKTALDLSNPDSNVAKYFLLDTSFIEYADEDEFIEILSGFMADESITEADLDLFDEVYNDAVKIIKLNYGKAENLDDYEKAGLNEEVKKYYDLMDDEDKKNFVANKLSGKSFTKFDGINNVFEPELKLAFISEYDNNDKVVELIEEFAGDLGLSSYISDFKSLNSIKKNAVIDAVKDNAPFVSASALEEPFKKAVKANMPKKESQGGGGSFSGGGTGIKQEITTTKDTEVKDIPADNFVPARVYKFADMSDYAWAEEAVKALYEGYVIDGASETEFNPAGQVKREEFVKMINPLYEGSEITAQFADMDMTLWYVPFINKAVGSGIIKGMDEKTFGIGQGVTRQDMAVMIYRVLKGEKAEAEAFADDSDIADYAKDAVYFLKSKGIISGTGEGNFEPSRVMTRAEAAVVVNNIIKLGK